MCGIVMELPPRQQPDGKSHTPTCCKLRLFSLSEFKPASQRLGLAPLFNRPRSLGAACVLVGKILVLHQLESLRSFDLTCICFKSLYPDSKEKQAPCPLLLDSLARFARTGYTPTNLTSSKCQYYQFFTAVTADPPSVARDGAWFKEYTPFDTVVDDKDIAYPLQVIGIGTVELPTMRNPCAVGEESQAILRLVNVLHAPTADCNIVGGKALSEEYQITIGPDSQAAPRGIITRGPEMVAYFESDRADSRIVLARSLHLDERTMSQGCREIAVFWADKERKKWAAHQAEPKATEEFIGDEEGDKNDEDDREDEKLEQLKPAWFIDA